MAQAWAVAATSSSGRPLGCGQLASGTRTQRAFGRIASQVTAPSVARSMSGQRAAGTALRFAAHCEIITGWMLSDLATAAAAPRPDPER